jgi:hypothetical protein
MVRVPESCTSLPGKSGEWRPTEDLNLLQERIANI